MTCQAALDVHWSRIAVVTAAMKASSLSASLSHDDVAMSVTLRSNGASTGSWSLMVLGSSVGRAW